MFAASSTALTSGSVTARSSMLMASALGGAEVVVAEVVVRLEEKGSGPAGRRNGQFMFVSVLFLYLDWHERVYKYTRPQSESNLRARWGP